MKQKLTAVVAATALALSIPSAALAAQGGVPSSTKPCPAKGQGQGPKQAPKNNKGKKCGFQRVVAPEPPPEEVTE